MGELGHQTLFYAEFRVGVEIWIIQVEDMRHKRIELHRAFWSASWIRFRLLHRKG